MEEQIEPTLSNYKSIKSYEDACKALGEDPKNFNGGLPNHIIALMKLETISRALWGRNFEPSYDSSTSADYYFPTFAINASIRTKRDNIKSSEYVAYATIKGIPVFLTYTIGFTYCNFESNFGFRLCQENEEKALYFGRKFVQLWAEYLDRRFDDK